MKTIILLRHAKSSWDQPFLEDFRRPLSARGRKAAPRVGRYMVRQGLIPERVLCSGAVRAVETWELVSETLGNQVPVEFRDEIYDASPRTLMELIRTLPDKDESILFVGHNPTFQMLALQLAGTGQEERLQELSSKFPTAALAVLDFRIQSWKDLAEGSGHLRDFVRPKDLDQG